MKIKLSLLLFPPRCVGCGELMSAAEGEREIFCSFCRTRWEASRIPDQERVIEGIPPILGAVSVVKYVPGNSDGVAERLIYHLKHQGHRRVFRYTAKELGGLIEKLVDAQKLPREELLITYPPRRKAAIRRDGFDQAYRLANAISVLEGWPVATLLTRTRRPQKEQKSLDKKEREINAQAAYALEGDLSVVKGRVLILVDDLYTTGATLESCGKLLLNAGARGVIFATVGRTKRKS